jgi:hypothetical protein
MSFFSPTLSSSNWTRDVPETLLCGGGERPVETASRPSIHLPFSLLIVFIPHEDDDRGTVDPDGPLRWELSFGLYFVRALGKFEVGHRESRPIGALACARFFSVEGLRA